MNTFRTIRSAKNNLLNHQQEAKYTRFFVPNFTFHSSNRNHLKYCGSTIPAKSGTNIKRDEIDFISHFKNPIIQQLWKARKQVKWLSKQQQPQQEGMTTDKETTINTEIHRTPSQSQTEVSYPFSTDELLKETYRNPFGNLRYGKILEDLDALAGNIAFHHVMDPYPSIVTASVDRIRLHRTPSLDTDHTLSGKVTYVGSSSMEIHMKIHSHQNNQEWLEAYFTFVATDPQTKKAIKIPPLNPETPEERAQWETGKLRAQLKKEARKRHPHTVPEEIQAKAMKLLSEASPLLNMPSLADPHSILASSTKMQSVELAQPQVQNMYHNIFGGFLMRKAFELAFGNCYVFGGAKPLFIEVDEISFKSPVDVGDLLVFNSKVLTTNEIPRHMILYQLMDNENQEKVSSNTTTNACKKDLASNTTTMPLVTIQVEAWVTEPEKASAKLSNQFTFTFALPTGTSCRHVLPSTMDESRQMVERMVIDAQEQANNIMTSRK